MLFVGRPKISAILSSEKAEPIAGRRFLVGLVLVLALRAASKEILKRRPRVAAHCLSTSAAYQAAGTAYFPDPRDTLLGSRVALPLLRAVVPEKWKLEATGCWYAVYNSCQGQAKGRKGTGGLQRKSPSLRVWRCRQREGCLSKRSTSGDMLVVTTLIFHLLSPARYHINSS